MEGDSNWKPNEQGRDSLASNANDWRSQHEPDLRKRVVIAIVEKLKICFPNDNQDDINNVALKFEGKIYGRATDKGDYLRKISEKIKAFDEKFNRVQSGSSVNGPNTTPDPEAQALNQGQSLPTSLPYMQPPTSQQWFPQNNIHSNLNIHESSGFSTQAPRTASSARSQHIQMGEGVHSNLLTGSQRQIQGRQQLLPQSQQQTHSSNDLFQRQVDQPYMQQHHRQLPHHRSLSTTQESFPQPYALSSLTPSGQQNSQFLPRHQFPTQGVHSSHQQQMVVPSKEQERQKLIIQLMNEETHQNHLTSIQNNGEQQGAFTALLSQQDNIASFQEMAQQNNNLQNMQQQQGLYSYSNNASDFPSQQQQYMPGGQSGNFNVTGTSLLGTQGQEVGQSQPMMLQQYQQNRILQQHLDGQAAGSFHQTQNVADQQNQPYPSQRAPPENPYTSQDHTGKMVNVSGEDWQEETYQKIKALKEMSLPVLSTILQKLSEKLQEVDSLPQQNMQHETIQKLKASKSTLELVIVFLNVGRNNILERHRDMFSLYEKQVLIFTKNHQTMTQRSLESQSGHQAHVLQSPDNGHMNSRLMPSHQNGASSQTAMPHSLQTRPNMEPTDEQNMVSSSKNAVLPSRRFYQTKYHHPQMQHQLQQRQQQLQIQNYSYPQLVNQQILPTSFHNTGTSLQSGGSPFVVPSPVTSFAPYPSLGDPEKPIYVESPASHGYQLQTAPTCSLPPQTNAEFQSSSPEALIQSVNEMSSAISSPDKLVVSVQSIGASLAKSLSARKSRLQEEETNQTKRRRITTLPLDITPQTDGYKHLSTLESEADSTASSASKVIQPGCALLQEIKDINGTLVETVVSICNGDVYPSGVTSGTIVTCSYAPVALSDTLKAHYKSGHIIQPLRLLVPANYPNSPILLLEKVPSDASLHQYDDLSARTRARFSFSMKEVSGVMSLKEIAKVWDVCARETMAEYAERYGGGTSSSKYGHWESALGES